ncbi:unnamed protein product [Gongylonema pulchrum]|uniref:Kinetochore protein SPC25 n=1 Tax=Gongylonema pulchrum TaxID=637853 RepID=A0A183DRX4_9BILA|nr:unnamed protein product [Gongylonema pulchrum]
MDQHLQELDEECAQYNSLMRSLKERPDTSFLDKTALRAKLSSMKNEEASLLAESKKLEAEEAKLDKELNKRKRELLLLKKEVEKRDAEASLRCLKVRLDKLSKINVLNTAFHIWQQGCFGTINGFRLGQLPHSQTLGDCLDDFHFSVYRIVPMGSYSFVQCIDSDVDLPLFGSGGFKPFGQKKLDEGICAFMDCFCQLQKRIERGEFRFPHRMYRDRIEDNKMEYSVKMQFNSEERWTKAMKCLLINFRWAISFVVVHSKVLASEENAA